MSKLIKVYIINNLKLNNLVIGPNRKKMWGFLLLMIFVVGSVLFTLGGYNYFLGSALLPMGAIEILPAMFMTAGSIVLLISVMFSSKGILFGFKDFDIQMSLPVPTGRIVASRIAILYIYELLYTVVIMLPSLVVYAWLARPVAEFYPIAVITLFFIPVIPMIIGALLGTLISIAASRFQKTNAIRIIVMLLFTLAVMALSFGTGNVDPNRAALYVNDMMQTVFKRYPPAMLYMKALSGDFLYTAAFILVSVVLFILFSLIVGKYFKKINTIISSVYTRGDFTLKKVTASGALASLYVKELKGYFSSALYVLNTSFGMILLLIASIATAIIGPEGIAGLLKIPLTVDLIAPILPLGISIVVCMSSTTCVSISMEGGRLWMLKTLPITPPKIFIAKIGVNLTITVPVVLLSSLLFSVVLRPGAEYTLYMFITPIVYCVFISVLGLAVNLQAPKLNWKNEAAVIKQSSAVLITMLIGFATSGIPLYLLLSSGSISALAVATLAVAAASAIIIVYLMKFTDKKFLSLG